jgi:hypothetical protein
MQRKARHPAKPRDYSTGTPPSPAQTPRPSRCATCAAARPCHDRRAASALLHRLSGPADSPACPCLPAPLRRPGPACRRRPRPNAVPAAAAAGRAGGVGQGPVRRGRANHRGRLARRWRTPPPALADCPAVARLRAAGAALTGHTNLSEFAFSGVGINPHHGTPPTRSPPHQPDAAHSRAARHQVAPQSRWPRVQRWAALGSDTGGSIRIPAALQGLVGFKNTAAAGADCRARSRCRARWTPPAPSPAACATRAGARSPGRTHGLPQPGATACTAPGRAADADARRPGHRVARPSTARWTCCAPAR